MQAPDDLRAVQSKQPMVKRNRDLDGLHTKSCKWIFLCLQHTGSWAQPKKNNRAQKGRETFFSDHASKEKKEPELSDR